MKKAKRYDEGGTAEEDKKAGLEASKNERVGFFERLRMGNIDDPKSEAYKRFGAGRGIAERSKVLPPAPSIRSTDSGMGVPGFGAPVMPKVEERMPASMPVGLRSAIEGAGVGEGGKAPAVVEKETTTVKTPRKTVTQTKKAVAKPDMAKEKVGKGYEEVTERLRKAPAAPKTSELRSVAKTRAGTPVKSSDSGTLGALGMGLGAAGLGLAGLRKRLMRAESGGGSESRDMGRYVRNSPVRELDPMMEASRMADEGNPNFKKGGKTKAKPVKKYAAGGMIGKASKRADGIAKKGKTKGRII